ncbi:hypothetical protein GT347_03195 [Xylophilus rhododendri]|uniref:Uncharacterized protein n=1 Tax=Xylophilus rhododendri TaxID=2697032 RepID=A0A857J1Q1_9BURK|nr:hypothetical protein [Xylophilus rhododendri]QHI97079.1 hypothetical protein GT347_03195 [Xylophilus rhododendri]
MGEVAYQHVLGKTVEALTGKQAWLAQCDLDKVAVALVLNRADWLRELDYTLVEATARVGPEWLALMPRVAYAVMGCQTL